MKADPKPYEWDFHGNCDPIEGLYASARFATFSVGCFQWLPRKAGGLKRGKVEKRFSGPTADAASVRAAAQAWCDGANEVQREFASMFSREGRWIGSVGPAAGWCSPSSSSS